MFEKNETTQDNLSLEISDAIRCGLRHHDVIMTL